MTMQQTASASIAPIRRGHTATSALGQTSNTGGSERFACIMARHLQLPDAPAIVATPTKDCRLIVSHLSCGAKPRACRPGTPMEDSFVVMLHLAEYRHAELWSRRGCPILASAYPKDSISVVNLMDDLSVSVGSPLDVLSFCIPRATLNQFTDDAGCRRITDLACTPALIDPVSAALGAALLPALQRPVEANKLVIDRISSAFLAHIAANFAGGALHARYSGGLTRCQEDRAKQYLTATGMRDLSLAGAAAACGLSRSYFSKAFKVSTGRSPNRWVLEHRIDKAKRLLRQSDPIAAIAVECGFTDQSHFTRTFTHVVGMPPGLWRRQLQG